MDTTTRPAVGTTYKTGDMNPVNGEYACVACEKSGGKHVIRVAQGAKFPECEKAATTWRLVSYS